MSIVVLRPSLARSVHASFAIDEFESESRCVATEVAALSPDETRILSLLATCGAQPVIDLRGCPLGHDHRALTNLAREAGIVGGAAKIQRYLDHLRRLGLVEVSEVVLPARRYEALLAEVGAQHAIRRCSVQVTDAGARRHESLLAAA